MRVGSYGLIPDCINWNNKTISKSYNGRFDWPGIKAPSIFDISDSIYRAQIPDTLENEFLTKVVASGRANVDFFYDVNTSKYYIYYSKFDSISAANKAMEDKGNKKEEPITAEI